MNSSIIIDCIDTSIDVKTDTNSNTTKSPKYALLHSPSNKSRINNNNNTSNINSRNNSNKDNSIKRSNSVLISNKDSTNNDNSKFSTRTFRPKSAPFARKHHNTFDSTEQLQAQWKDSVDVFFQNRVPVENAYNATMNELAQSEFAEYYDNDDSVSFTPLGNIDDNFNNYYRPRTGFKYHVAENVKLPQANKKSQTTTFSGPFNNTSSSTLSRPGTVSNLNIGQRKDTCFCGQGLFGG